MTESELKTEPVTELEIKIVGCTFDESHPTYADNEQLKDKVKSLFEQMHVFMKATKVKTMRVKLVWESLTYTVICTE
jgi:hypothetical protein